MKENSLLLFVISPNVGTYINAMTHAVIHHGINKIVLVHIDNAPIGEPIDFSQFRKDLENAIDELPNGKYLTRQKDGSLKTENFELPNEFTGYSKLKDIYKRNHVVKDLSYDWLKSNLQSLIKQFGECIVDLTGVVKRVAFDIFIACSYIGIDKVTTFEKKDHTKYGVNALYHNLNPPNDSEYVFLHNSSEFIDSLDAISTKKNWKKLVIVMVAILLAAFVIFVDYQYRDNPNESLRAVVIASQIFAIFGGILPLLDAWGGIRISKLFRKK